MRHPTVEKGQADFPIVDYGKLTVVAGVVVATGAMTLSDGSVSNSVYMVAAQVIAPPDFP